MAYFYSMPNSLAKKQMTRRLLLSAIILTCFGCSSNTPTSTEPTEKTGQTINADTASSNTETSKNPSSVEEAGDPSAAQPSAKVSSPEQPAPSPAMPIYISPYYDSEGLQINVGPFSDELAAATADSISDLSTKMKSEWESLPIETMYIASIRLYDLGHKNEAVYWFYSAQYRANLLKTLLREDSIGGFGSEAFSRVSAYNAFNQLAGEYINGYGYGDLEKMEKTIKSVLSENEQLPQLNTIYPNLKLVDDKSWPAKNKFVADSYIQQIEFIGQNADKIKAIRKENGIDDKY